MHWPLSASAPCFVPSILHRPEVEIIPQQLLASEINQKSSANNISCNNNNPKHSNNSQTSKSTEINKNRHNFSLPFGPEVVSRLGSLINDDNKNKINNASQSDMHSTANPDILSSYEINLRNNSQTLPEPETVVKDIQGQLENSMIGASTYSTAPSATFETQLDLTVHNNFDETVDDDTQLNTLPEPEINFKIDQGHSTNSVNVDQTLHTLQHNADSLPNLQHYVANAMDLHNSIETQPKTEIELQFQVRSPMSSDLLQRCSRLVSPLNNVTSVLVAPPRVMAIVEQVPTQFLLDTGAEISVLSLEMFKKIQPDVTDISFSTVVNAFGGVPLQLGGPYELNLNICGVDFRHPFYIIDAPTNEFIPCIAGHDLMRSAHLIIDTASNFVWSTKPTRLTPYTIPAASPSAFDQSSTELQSLSDIPESSCPRAHSSPSAILTCDVSHHSDSALCSAHTASDATAVKQPELDSAQPDMEGLPAHLLELYQTTVTDADLTPDIAKALKDLLIDQQQVFAKNSMDLGYCDVIAHDIDTGEHHPIKQSPRLQPLAARQAEDDIITEMLQTGVVEPSLSPWASPVCMVKKKDNTYRFCVDYRRLNSVTKKDAFPIPAINEAFDSLKGSKCWASIDLLSGYWQLPLTDRAKERSAFCCRRGLFQFTRMAFGLNNAPSSFSRLMQTVLSDLLWKICLNYLDDIICFASSPLELIERLRTVFQRLQDVGLRAKPSKCCLLRTSLPFLGHVVTKEGIQPQPEKLEAIRDWVPPRCLKEVRAFFGLCSYYRRFVKDFANISEPLTRLTKKNARFEWTAECQQAFETLKTKLIEATTLAYPDPNLPVILDTDASDVAVGAVISQVIEGQERPIAFFSRVMNNAQRNYCPTRRELLAVIVALQHFRHYLLGAEVILRTDHHSLKWLNTFKRPEGILARWMETLAEFSYEVQHRPGKVHGNADSVSRPFCKQCWDRPARQPWIEELQRADEVIAPLGINTVTLQPEISQEDIIHYQATDTAIQPICELILLPNSPTNDDLRALPLESRNLWSQRPAIQLQSDVLVRVTPTATQLVVPYCLRYKLFKYTHAGPLSAHLGADRTLAQLQQHYYWVGMKKDIERWYGECVPCAQAKPAPSRPKGKLQKVIAGAPMDIVAIDILSGLPATPKGYKYLLVATDYFTKWCEAYPLVDAEAATCMQALYSGFFSRFGLPRQLHSDQGTNFENKLFSELCQITGINKTRTTAFHPRSDGQTERLNRTILQMLRATAADNPADWPAKIPIVLAAYRMTVHSTTNVTPNLAMLGREVLLPTTLIARPPEEAVKTTVPFVTSFRDNLRVAHDKVRAATHNTAKVQKTYFDQQVRGPPFAVNQRVWLYWPRPQVRSKYKKLCPLWDGPWIIVKFRSSIVVVIQHELSGKRQTVHIDRLTPCRLPEAIQSGPAEQTVTQQLAQTISAPPMTEHQSAAVAPPIAVPDTTGRPHRQRRKPVRLHDYD